MTHAFGPWATSIDAGGNPQLSTFWRRRLTMLVPTSQTSPALSRRNLFCLGAAAALMLVVPTFCPISAVADEAKAAALVYQVDPKLPAADWTASDMEKLLKVVDLRLNAGAEKLATVRKLDDRRIEVALLRADAKDRKRVERLIARPGTLEFRILANNRDNKDLIDSALKENAKDEILDSAGKKQAWWVPVKADAAKSLAGYRDIALRTKKKGDRDVTEVLVVPDAQNVTGDYLARVEPGVDQAGRPNVSFRFNAAGGKLFGELTSSHLPDDTDRALTYKLGIILDGELFSAPSIQSTIRDSGEITGSFSKDEVVDLANTLNAGSLPGRLRWVEPNRHNKR